jgi:hypothetical protein
MPTFRNTLYVTSSQVVEAGIITGIDVIPVILAYTANEDGTSSVPKRRHIKFRRRGIAQKKE